MRYVDRLALIQGTYVWSAKLSDPQLINELEVQMLTKGKQTVRDIRPQLLGYDQVASGLLMLTNHIIALRLEAGRGSKVEMIKGPVFPMEIVEERMAKYAKSKRDGGIDAAQGRYAARKAAGLPVVDGAVGPVNKARPVVVDTEPVELPPKVSTEQLMAKVKYI